VNVLASEPAIREGSSARERRAMLALLRVEAIRLVRHPIVAGALVLYAAFWGYLVVAHRHIFQYPVLQCADQLTELALLPLAFAVMLTTNITALRRHRHGAGGNLDVLALPQWRRTLASLLALIPAGLITALLAGVHITFLALHPNAAGRLSATELATGPATVVLFGAAGILLARLIRSALAAPLILVVLLAYMYISANYFQFKIVVLAWVQPVVPPVFVPPLPADLIGRPAAWHLLYVTGVAVLVGSAALLRSGARKAVLASTAAGATAITVTAVVLQTMPPSSALTSARVTASDRPARTQVCGRHGNTLYCAFPDFARWTDDWDQVVRGVRDLLPEQPATMPLTVRQRVDAIDPYSLDSDTPTSWAADDKSAGTPDSISAGTAWGSDISRLQLAANVTFRIVTGSAAVTDSSTQEMCGPRGVLVMWLAVEATPQTAAGFRQLQSLYGSGAYISTFDSYSGGLSLRPREQGLFYDLEAMPRSQVGQRVKAAWPELVSAKTSIARAAALLGAPIPPGSDEPCE
jgi:hypothetical protein